MKVVLVLSLQTQTVDCVYYKATGRTHCLSSYFSTERRILSSPLFKGTGTLEAIVFRFLSRPWWSHPWPALSVGELKVIVCGALPLCVHWKGLAMACWDMGLVVPTGSNTFSQVKIWLSSCLQSIGFADSCKHSICDLASKMDICLFHLYLSIAFWNDVFEILLWFEKWLGGSTTTPLVTEYTVSNNCSSYNCHLPFKHVMQHSTVLHGQLWVWFFIIII